MCKRTYTKEERICKHVIEMPGHLVPEPGCGMCGIEKGKNNSIAWTIKQTPCDNCLASGRWAQTGTGKWYQIKNGPPQKLASGYKFPCQFLFSMPMISFWSDDRPGFIENFALVSRIHMLSGGSWQARTTWTLRWWFHVSGGGSILCVDKT